VTLSAVSRGVWAADSPWHLTEEQWDDWLIQVETPNVCGTTNGGVWL
jgi:hypothetical protein